MPIFLDYFEYAYTEKTPSGEHVFHDIKFLREVGNYQPGDKAEAIQIGIEFFIWDDGELVEDIVENY
jgi:hypothetical protein